MRVPGPTILFTRLNTQASTPSVRATGSNTSSPAKHVAATDSRLRLIIGRA
jgi:hypothetical protein